MIVKDLADTFHRSGRKAVRELPDRRLDAGYISVRFVGHQPAQAFLVPGVEFFHFCQIGITNGDAHERRFIIGKNHLVIFS